MPKAAIPAIVGAAGSVGGALIGNAGKSGSQSAQATGMNNPLTGGVDYSSINPNSTFGQAGGMAQNQALMNYQSQVQGANPYTANANSGLAQMLQQMSQTGGLPNQQQITQANQYASNLLAPSFQQAGQNTARQAAALGRPTDDPVLQAKLAQYQGQQQGQLANQMALQLPQQQLGFQQQLAQQAMQNQLGLFQLGNQQLSNAQNYNLGFRGSNVNQQSGGGLGGLLGGAAGGLAQGLNFSQNPFGNSPGSGGTGYTGSESYGSDSYSFNPTYSGGGPSLF